MKDSVKKLYTEAINNDEFLNSFKQQDPEFAELAIDNFWYRLSITDKQRIIIACVYQGWLMRNNEFDDSKYY